MYRSVMFLFVFILLLAALGPAVAQTMWFKYEGNPVLRPGPAGAWDNGSVYPSCVILEYRDPLPPIYRMWYSGWDGSFYRTGHATSPDGVQWTKSPGNPVLREGPAPWESGGSSEVYVLRTESGYSMWYMGEDFSANWRIGYASSSDGLTWVKSMGASPVLGTGSWYQRGSHNPMVMVPPGGGKYFMWFEGNPIAHADFQIGYATASDETTWTPREQPVFSWGAPGSWDDDKVFCPRVLKNGREYPYEMWYCGERTNGRTQIGYAISDDGIEWTRYSANPVVQRGPAAWDLQDIYALDVLFDNAGLYRMWYGGMDSFPDLPHGVGYAISPAGMSVNLSRSDSLVPGDTIRVTVRAPSRLENLYFFVEVESPEEAPIDSIVLYNDGVHGDSLSGDGVFANSWIVPSGGKYWLDLKLTLKDSMTFEMNTLATFNVPTTSVSQESEISGTFMLEQNYPNPFNPATEIRYRVHSSGEIRLGVFDLLGREVAVLVNEQKAAGSYQVKFDAGALSSGVYLYRLTSGTFTHTRKMLILQ